jgi:hypothetical protein
MNQDFSIIILTKENGDCIINTMDVLQVYANKHPSLRQIIVADDASRDNTLPSIIDWIHKHCDNRFSLLTQPVSIGEKKILMSALEQVNTAITVLLDAELYTRLHQIRYQIALLKKVDLVLPSRLHRLSKTNYTPNLLQGIHVLLKDQKKYEDLSNPQKSFRTNIILQALKKNKSSKILWSEIIEENPSIKYTICPTHWKTK